MYVCTLLTMCLFVCLYLHIPLHTVQVSEDGRTLSTMGSERVLAGSCCSMVDILHNLVNVIGLPLGQAVAMLAENPAR